MLHILWLILKMILILLGVFLGVVLLLLLLLLFCPVRYQGQGKKDGEWKEAEGQVGISWLFRGICVTATRKNGESGISVRVLGISVEKFKAWIEKRKEKKQKKAGQKNIGENQARENIRTEEGSMKKIPRTDTEEVFEEEDFFEEDSAFPENTPKLEADKNKGLFRRISEKLAEIPGKIKNIRLTFNRIHGKIDWWKRYIHHPKVKAAASLVWSYAKGLLRHILPTKVWGNVIFGFSDPSVTGRVLGLVGMSFPLHKNRVAVHPRFNGENILEGEICFKGRIYGIVLLKAAVVIYFNKNVKYAIKRAKHGKHKED